MTPNAAERRRITLGPIAVMSQGENIKASANPKAVPLLPVRGTGVHGNGLITEGKSSFPDSHSELASAKTVRQNDGDDLALAIDDEGPNAARQVFGGLRCRHLER